LPEAMELSLSAPAPPSVVHRSGPSTGTVLAFSEARLPAEDSEASTACSAALM